MPSKDELVELLSMKFGYSFEKAPETAERLLSANKKIQDAFIDYLKDKTVSPLTIEGYDMKFFMQKYKMSAVAALLSLDWIIREPERAKKIIKRGYDRVILK